MSLSSPRLKGPPSRSGTRDEAEKTYAYLKGKLTVLKSVIGSPDSEIQESPEHSGAMDICPVPASPGVRRHATMEGSKLAYLGIWTAMSKFLLPCLCTPQSPPRQRM